MTQRYDTARLVAKPSKVANGALTVDRKRSDLRSPAVTLKQYLYGVFMYYRRFIVRRRRESETFIVIIFVNRLINHSLRFTSEAEQEAEHARHL